MRTYTGKSTGFLGNSGRQGISAGRVLTAAPSASVLTIDWRAQASAAGEAGAGGLGVKIDLKKGYVADLLQAVKSVYIDNSNVEQPIYLQADDTGQVVPCRADAMGMFDLITDGMTFTLYVNDVSALRDNGRLTRLIFTNVSLTPFGF